MTLAKDSFEQKVRQPCCSSPSLRPCKIMIIFIVSFEAQRSEGLSVIQGSHSYLIFVTWSCIDCLRICAFVSSCLLCLFLVHVPFQWWSSREDQHHISFFDWSIFFASWRLQQSISSCFSSWCTICRSAWNGNCCWRSCRSTNFGTNLFTRSKCRGRSIVDRQRQH